MSTLQQIGAYLGAKFKALESRVTVVENSSSGGSGSGSSHDYSQERVYMDIGGSAGAGYTYVKLSWGKQFDWTRCVLGYFTIAANAPKVNGFADFTPTAGLLTDAGDHWEYTTTNTYWAGEFDSSLGQYALLINSNNSESKLYLS